MYRMEQDEARSLLQNMRQLQRLAEETATLLERIVQHREDRSLRDLSYDPDAYLNREGCHIHETGR